MGFLTGSATYTRLRLDTPGQIAFDERHLEALAKHAAGKQRFEAETQIGWTGGEHLFDTAFEWDKNHYDGRLWFAARWDTNKLPADLLKAYTAIDLAALAKNNPSGFATTRQKREAKESARDRLEQEAKDGRFIKRKCIECLWLPQYSELWFGATSPAKLTQFITLWESTFPLPVKPYTATTLAERICERIGWSDKLAGIRPTWFALKNKHIDDIAWVPDEASRDWLGNEFLVWLWWLADERDGDVTVAGSTRLTAVINGGIKLECPRGMTGDDTCRREFPANMPEAMAALREGKLPRKMGLQLIVGGSSYSCVLQAETFAVSGLKVPTPEEEDSRARLLARLAELEQANLLLTLLYERFLEDRLAGWGSVGEKIREWVS